MFSSPMILAFAAKYWGRQKTFAFTRLQEFV